MRVQHFFDHHRLKENPFTQEDAKEDLVFLRGCIDHTFHPLWGRIFGHPEAPSAAVVFGERGSGKTALRFQIAEHLKKFNQANPDRRVLVLEYQDFNPFIDEFSQHTADLAEWGLPDHMDAILSLGTQKLVNAILEGGASEDGVGPERVGRLDTHDRRDLMMLAVTYDRSDRATTTERCRRLARALGYHRRWWLLPTVCLLWPPYLWRWFSTRKLAREVSRRVRVLRHDVVELRRLLLRFRGQDLARQPITRLNDDARYGLLTKLIEVGKKLGFATVVVVVDRVDEPTLVKGDPGRMFHLMRSVCNLKFFGHGSFGVKLLLPMELYRPMLKDLDDNVARLDKHHLCRSLHWSGASLYDLINARLAACSDGGGQGPTLRSLLDDGVSDSDIMSWLAQLKIPRNVFKFMDRLIERHCQAHTDDRPAWRISHDTFVESRADFKRVVEDYERGLLMG